MFRFGASVVLALGLLAWAPARAQQIQTLWSCKDKDGRTLFTSQKADTAGKECKVISEERVSAAPAAKAKSPANFPRESAAERQAAKGKQRDTLERELAQEESMLTDSKRKLAEQEAIRTGDEKNYQRVLDRLKPYQDTIEVHQKNVEALRRELSNLSR
jgi:septal ring factor EnvC (AmiA/AmiB activator)